MTAEPVDASAVPGPVDLDAIQARCRPPDGCDCDLCNLVAEVKRLRGDLSAFKPQPMSQQCRDGRHNQAGVWRCHNCRCLCHAAEAEVARLRGALQAVRDLHRPHTEKSGTVVCSGCLCVWPCFTEQMLDAPRFDAVLGGTE